MSCNQRSISSCPVVDDDVHLDTFFNSGLHQGSGLFRHLKVQHSLHKLVVEPMGDSDKVDVKKDNVNFTLLAELGAGARMDKSVTVLFDMNRSHIFDKVSGENLIISR